MARLRSRQEDGLATPGADAEAVGAQAPEHRTPLAFLSRCVVVQAIGAAGIVGLWIAGIASKPFEGDNAYLCWLIVGIAALGILCVFLQRWRDVEWLATHVVRIGLLGTVIGLIMAFSAAKAGGSADLSEIKPMIAAVVDGMYVRCTRRCWASPPTCGSRSIFACSVASMDEETLTVWLDTALLMLGGFVLMSVLMMTVMNPPTKSSESDNVQAPGNVIIEAQWPDKLDADVDLWVQAPGDVPVGYSNKSGHIFNLLRDDLGKSHDMTDYNYEVAYTRGARRRIRHQPSHVPRPERCLPGRGQDRRQRERRSDRLGQTARRDHGAAAQGGAGDDRAPVPSRRGRRPHRRQRQQPVQTATHGRQMIISAIVFALLLGTFIFLILPRARLARRTLSVGIFVILIAVIYGSSIELLGRPKPLRLEWRGTADAQVLSAMPVENEAIYVWLVMPGATEPCAYVRPEPGGRAQPRRHEPGRGRRHRCADGDAVRGQS